LTRGDRSGRRWRTTSAKLPWVSDHELDDGKAMEALSNVMRL
jgi:hypothetical protein